MFQLDHVYTEDQNFSFFEKLKGFGFTDMNREVEHPGKHFCQFIAFAAATRRGHQYLEFISVKEGGSRVETCGVSFGTENDLEDVFRNYLENKEKFKAKITHKNYLWKTDNISILPGWNFLVFEELRLDGILPWVTEYQSDSSRTPFAPELAVHPNGVTGIHGLVLQVNEEGQEFFSYFFKTPITDQITLACGKKLYFEKAARNRVSQIVLESKGVSELSKKYPFDGEMNFRGQPALLIEKPNKSSLVEWDMVIV